MPKDSLLIAVIGAGTMGTGIAYIFAKHGHSVTLVSRHESSLHRARKNIEGFARRELQDQETEEVLGFIDLTTDIRAGVRNADIVSESVPEDRQLKRDILRIVAEETRSDTILTSNTSSISITQLAEDLPNPQRVAGLHWFNPAHLMPLVEVVRGRETSKEVARRLAEVCTAIGKVPIIVERDIAGFIANRLQYAIFREALALYTSGSASLDDIDKAISSCLALRWLAVGPLRSMDMNGLDVIWAVAQNLYPELDASQTPPKILKEMVEAKRLGFKTGAGLADYSPYEIERILSERDEVLARVWRLRQEIARMAAEGMQS